MSDFAKNLAQITSTEESAAAAYVKESHENDIEKTHKQQAVVYKSKAAADLDKSVEDLSSDRESSQTELDAGLSYLAELKKQCIAVPETYSERKSRREAELAGLKEALQILDG